jgi:hypothetical protein
MKARFLSIPVRWKDLLLGCLVGCLPSYWVTKHHIHGWLVVPYMLLAGLIVVSLFSFGETLVTAWNVYRRPPSPKGEVRS